MKLQVAQFEHLGAYTAIVLVDSKYTEEEEGKALIARLEPHLKGQPIMLVSVEANGFRAFSYFQSHTILSLIQLENLSFYEVDLSAPLPEPELPF